MTKKLAFLCLVAVVLLTSCEPMKTVSSNQQSYEAAAKAAIQCKLDFYNEKVTSIDNCPSKNAFQEVVANMEKLLNEQQEELIKNDLLPDVYTLLALSALGADNFEKAELYGSKALAELQKSNITQSRDLALTTAMPGLIKANQLFYKIPNDDFQGVLNDSIFGGLEDLANSAVADIEDGQKKVNATHEVQQYLVSSKLAVLKNILDINTFTVDKDSPQSDVDEKEAREAELLAKAKVYIDALQSIGASSEVVMDWKMAIGVD